MDSVSRSVYCICGQPYEETRFMIQCDNCREWYHGSCVNLYEYDSYDLDKYHCPQCALTVGPSVLKKPTNFHRHNKFDKNADGKPVQTGTIMFIEELKTRHFPSSESVVTRLTAQELTIDNLQRNGFHQPIIVEEKEGLGLKVPSEYFTVQDVASLVGAERKVDVIDVTRQSAISMSVGNFSKYFNDPDRTKILNLISLELSETRMCEVIEPPLIARQLDWVHNVWPMSIGRLPTVYKRPEVQKYCLISVKDSYTDFHIDFGGTSVWYHILRGEKIFYLIKPTMANLSLYERWMASSTQSETFFGDQVDCCYRFVLHAGHTMFIPSGWIHAVLTPVDSLVFGGNFLHNLSVPLQLQIYEIEKKTNTGHKFMFPNFEAINWYAAQRLCNDLKTLNDEATEVPSYILAATKALLTTLKQWSQDKDAHKSRREDIPVIVNAPKLLKDLSKGIRNAERYIMALNPPKPERESKRKKRKPLNKDFYDFSNPHASLIDAKQESKVTLVKTKKSAVKNEVPKEETIVRPPLKLTLPKPVTYPYSTLAKAETSSCGSSTPLTLPSFKFKSSPSSSIVSQLHGSSWVIANKMSLPDVKTGVKAPGTGLKVRLAKAETKPYRAEVSASYSPVASTSHYQDPSTYEQRPTESVYDFHDDSSVADDDEHCLTIDESPRRQRWSKCSVEQSLALSSHNNLQNQPNLGMPSVPGQSSERILMTLKGVKSTKRLKPNEGSSTTNGSLPPKNGIEELLKASGYGDNREETRLYELETGRTSPSTREAIAGMLSISRVGFLGEGPTGSPQPSTSRGKKRKTSLPEEVEDIENVHQDDEYIYPALDVSEDEEESQRSTRTNKKTSDETWSPKARVGKVAPKSNRPCRDGAKKDSVEKGLKAAAAKRAGQPNPKRAYNKKKPRMTSSAVTSSAISEATHSLMCSAVTARVDIMKPSTPKLTRSVSQPVMFTTSTMNRSNPHALDKGRKPKKGMATTKQRLSKLLKINKLYH